MIQITLHACERWVERVDPSCNVDTARQAMLRHQRAIEAAIRFGCRCVLLGNGVRLVICDFAVVTVLARGQRSVPMRIAA